MVSGFTTLADGTEESILARYGTDGTLGRGIRHGRSGADERLRLQPGSPPSQFVRMAKIVAVGSSQERALGGGRTNSAVALARYETDGALDATFGTAGVVTTRFTGSAGANAVALQGDGRIVAAGSFWATSATRVVPRGRPLRGGRTSSTRASRTLARRPPNAAYWARDMAIQPDGRIVVVGDGDRAP